MKKTWWGGKINYMTELKEGAPEIRRETFGARQKDIDGFFIAKLIKQTANGLGDSFRTFDFKFEDELQKLESDLSGLVEETYEAKTMIAGDIAVHQDYFKDFIRAHYNDRWGEGHEVSFDEDQMPVPVNEESGEIKVKIAVWAKRGREKPGEPEVLEKLFTLYASPEAVARYKSEIKPKVERFLKLRQEAEANYDKEEHSCFERVEDLIRKRGENTHFAYEEWKKYLTIFPPGSTDTWSARVVQDGIEIVSFDENGHFLYTSLLPKPKEQK